MLTLSGIFFIGAFIAGMHGNANDSKATDWLGFILFIVGLLIGSLAD